VVATEHGLARLKGRTISERIRAMVAVAAPEHRERLLREAREVWGAT
jgi:acyl-CoA hydrolase